MSPTLSLFVHPSSRHRFMIAPCLIHTPPLLTWLVCTSFMTALISGFCARWLLHTPIDMTYPTRLILAFHHVSTYSPLYCHLFLYVCIQQLHASNKLLPGWHRLYNHHTCTNISLRHVCYILLFSVPCKCILPSSFSPHVCHKVLFSGQYWYNLHVHRLFLHRVSDKDLPWRHGWYILHGCKHTWNHVSYRLLLP